MSDLCSDCVKTRIQVRHDTDRALDLYNRRPMLRNRDEVHPDAYRGRMHIGVASCITT